MTLPVLVMDNSLEEETIGQGILYAPKEKGKEVLFICETCETFISQLYTELLNEYFSDAALKNMMNYQLLGIQSGFMRIRFLNSLRFNRN